MNFSENLKYYRAKHGLTQKQLAQRIGYTEKSVSKWETGGALPSMEMALQLAELFNIPLDELLFEKTMRHYFLGIDGGGTKTAFKLVDESGAVVAQLCKGPSNPNDIGMDAATAVLKEGISQVCGGIPYANVTMFAGLSGGGLTGDNAAILRRFFSKFGFHAFGNGSDVENLVALSRFDKCVLVIMGTGFIVYALNGGEKKRISGWGQFFDDGGSGYTLGRDAIAAALSASDGSGRPTALTQLLQQRLGESAQQHLAKFYQGGKRYIAEFADLVFLAAESGDAVALEILEKNMAFVAGKISSALAYLADPARPERIPVLFSGGISENNGVLFPLLEKYLPQDTCSLTKLDRAPVDGAVEHAKRIFAANAKGETRHAENYCG